MPFQNGTFTDLGDLRSKIRTFLATQGFTATSGDAIHNGSDLYVEIEHSVDLHTDGASNYYDALLIRMGTGESGGAITGWNGCVHQVREYINRTYYDGIVIMSFPGNYYFFWDATAKTFFCVISTNSGITQWLGFGRITQFGTWTGGRWCGASFGNYFVNSNHTPFIYHHYASENFGGYHPNALAFFFGTAGTSLLGTGTNSPNMVLECDIDGSAGDWISNSLNDARSFSPSILNAYRRYVGYNSFDDSPLLVPIEIGIYRASSKTTNAGILETARHVKMLNNVAGDIVTLGSDKWMLFPHIKRYAADFAAMGEAYSLGADRLHSGVYGFAIKYDGP